MSPILRGYKDLYTDPIVESLHILNIIETMVNIYNIVPTNISSMKILHNLLIMHCPWYCNIIKKWSSINFHGKRKIQETYQLNPSVISLQNRFNQLINNANSTKSQQKSHRPPPTLSTTSMILILWTIKWQQLSRQTLQKSMPKEAVKIQCTDSFRKLAELLKDVKIGYHTDQLKEDRAFREAIRYLHHTINADEIIAEFTKYGHKIRNLLFLFNIPKLRNRHINLPGNMFFIDLEPAANVHSFMNAAFPLAILVLISFLSTATNSFRYPLNFRLFEIYFHVIFS